MHTVYRGMTQEELETQYSARGTVDDFDAEMRQYRELSEASYAELNVIRDIAYGTGNEERIDLFPAKESNSPLFVFFHGGYWRALGRRDSAMMARTLVDHGISVALVEYTLAPIAGLDQIVDQARRAVVHLAHNGERLGFDEQQIFLGGSSAGGHLCGMVLTPEWRGQYDLPDGAIKGALLASGLFDLEPVRLCVPNQWLNLDKSAARRNSPQYLPMPSGIPLLVTWGGAETDEFKRQSQEYSKVARLDGAVVDFEVTDRNHFNIIVDLADPDRRLCRSTLEMILG